MGDNTAPLAQNYKSVASRRSEVNGEIVPSNGSVKCSLIEPNRPVRRRTAPRCLYYRPNNSTLSGPQRKWKQASSFTGPGGPLGQRE